METNNEMEEEFGSEPEPFPLTKEVRFVELVFDSIMKRCRNNPSLIGNADRAFWQRTHNGLEPPNPRKTPTRY